MTGHPSASDPRPVVLVPLEADLLAARRAEQDAGWTAQASWDLPADRWDCRDAGIVCVVRADDRVSAEDSVAVASRGAGLVVAVDLDSPLGTELLADLRRIGPVTTAAPEPGGDLGLTTEQLEVLRLVAEGCTLPEVAKQLLLSTRTAERRLGAARKALGVRSTAQAIVRYLESGGPGA